MLLPTGHPTLIDVARMSGPDGSPAKIAEVMQTYQEVLEDVPWVEGNLTAGHKSVLRASIPPGTFRLINKGVQPVKSTGKQVIDDTAQIVNYSEVDKTLAKLSKNVSQYRFNQAKAIMQGMADSFVTALFYGDSSVNPEQFNGLSSRYFAKTGQPTSGQIIDAGGTGTDNTSIYLIGWAPEETIFGIYPPGFAAGINQEDLGEVTLFDADGGRYQGYRSYFEYNCGIAVSDWRGVVRIANIDVSDLMTAGLASDTSANLIRLLSIALDTLPPGGNLRPVFYANKLIASMLRIQYLSKANVHLSLEDLKGASGITRKTLGFLGTPIRRVDAITLNEARVV